MANSPQAQSRIGNVVKGQPASGGTGMWSSEPGAISDRSPKPAGPMIPKTNVPSPTAALIGQLLLQQLAAMHAPPQPEMPQQQPYGVRIV